MLKTLGHDDLCLRATRTNDEQFRLPILPRKAWVKWKKDFQSFLTLTSPDDPDNIKMSPLSQVGNSENQTHFSWSESQHPTHWAALPLILLLKN